MKVAVIIVGKFLNKKVNGDVTELDEIKRCYDLDNSNTDIFIYNNCTLEMNKKLVEYFGEDKIKFIDTIKYSFHEKICKDIIDTENLPTSSILVKKKQFFNDCVNEGIIGNRNLSIHVPFKDANFFNQHSFRSGFHQYYHLHNALLEIEKYEKENGIKYDFIMKIRPDFFLKHDKFGPNHYFSDKNNILLKSYNNLKYYYDKIEEDDSYHVNEYRINNYLYWRTTKFLGGQYILNKESYNQIEPHLNNRTLFNNKIKKDFVITINDACFFSNGDNFKKIIKTLFEKWGEFYTKDIKFWWTAEANLQLSIIHTGLYYLDYVQNNNYYDGIEMWVNSYHGTEKYDKSKMNTSGKIGGGTRLSKRN